MVGTKSLLKIDVVRPYISKGGYYLKFVRIVLEPKTKQAADVDGDSASGRTSAEASAAGS
jgi:hypothetical protein